VVEQTNGRRALALLDARRVSAAPCPHRHVIEVGHRLERDRQPDGSVRRRCFVIARCRLCGAKLLQLYDLRRSGGWVESDADLAKQREAS
jgi:hypothetical protein